MQYAASIASAGVIVILIAYTIQQANKAAAQPQAPQVGTPTCITALNTLSYRAQEPTKYEEIIDGCISAVPADSK